MARSTSEPRALPAAAPQHPQAARQAEIEAAAAAVHMAAQHPRLLRDMAARCSESDFNDPRLGEIFGAALRLHAQGKPVSFLTITAELERRGLHLPALKQLLEELAQAEGATLPSLPELAIAAAGLVREGALRRREVKLSADLATAVGKGEAIEKRAALTAELAEVQRELEQGGKPRILFPPAAERIHKLWSKPRVPPITTGFGHLDKVLMGGLAPGRPSVLIASTGRGKSSLGVQICVHVMQSFPVLYLTRDMPEIDIYARFLAQIRHASWRSIKELGPAAATELAADAELKLPRLTVMETMPDLAIGDLVRAFVAQHQRVPFIVVDTLQDLAHDMIIRGGGNIFDAIGTTSKALKSVASEHAIVVFILSHDSRSFNREQSRRNKGARAFESAGFGSSAIDKDVNTLLYLETDATPQDGSSKARLHIAKQTGGPAGVTVGLTYHGAIGCFSERAETDLDQDRRERKETSEAADEEEPADLEARITAELQQHPEGLNQKQIRLAVKAGKPRVGAKLAEMVKAGKLTQEEKGTALIYRLQGPQQALPGLDR